MNGRFQIAMHILTLLGMNRDELLSSEYIAGSVNTNPALIRKELSNLRDYGLISSKEGKNGGYALSKAAELITLADVYQSVKLKDILGHAKNSPNPKCVVGKQINGHLDALYKETEAAIMGKLKATTLLAFCVQFE